MEKQAYLLERYHPSWAAGRGQLFSTGNVRRGKGSAAALAGFLSGLAYAEREGLGNFPPGAFAICGRGLPAIGSPGAEGEAPRDAALRLGRELIFGGKDPFRGRVPAELSTTALWFRRAASGGGRAAGEQLVGLIEAARADGVPIEFPPLWSAGIRWRRAPFRAGGASRFSAENPVFRSLLAHASAVEGACFYELTSGLPFPFASLEPLTGLQWLKEFVPRGAGEIGKGLASLLSAKGAPAVLWAAGVDEETRKSLDVAAEKADSPLVVCMDGYRDAPGEIEEVSLLWLTPEGGLWFKDNCARAGMPGEERLASLAASEDPMRFSAFAPLFPGETGPRQLIESGQVSLALEELERTGRDDAEASFLRASALSVLLDNATVIRIAEKTEGALGEEDAFSMKLLHSQALWLSGRVYEGREMLLGLLGKETPPSRKFRVLSQLSMLYILNGEEALAEKALRDAAPLLDGKDHRGHFLWRHHYGCLERGRDRLDAALGHFSAALSSAREGGFRHLESFLLVEKGNVLRLLGKFGEAAECFSEAVSGAKALRLKVLEETAEFDLAVTELEAGDLLKAEGDIRRLIEKRELKALPIDRAVEHYWLARSMFLRGELTEALEEAEKGLDPRGAPPSGEIGLALRILKGNILFARSDARALQLLVNGLSAREFTGESPDLLLEYYALLSLAAKMKVARFTARESAAAEEAFEKASPLSRASYLLAKARSARGGDSSGAAMEAYRTGRSMNSVSVQAEALSILLEAGRMPALRTEELLAVKRYVESNRVTGPAASLLKVAGNEIPEKKETRRPGARGQDLLEIAGCEAMVLVPADGEPSVVGCVTERAACKIAELAVSLCSGSRAATQAVPPGEGGETPFLDKFVVGSSAAMASVKRKIMESAAFNFPVLVTGEPGTGKEVCARAIHFASPRGRKPWVAFNCANLTPTLATSQLFGHRKGSFTGADSDREGLVAAAKDSTLFLDEIGELPLETQAQFLRFLQDGSYQPLGSSAAMASNARIIAATNRNLEEEVDRGAFREDLYYRLKVLTIEMPPLRDRREDILPLFEKFLEEECARENVRKPSVERAALLKLLSHGWNGNVRELQNAVRRLIVASSPAGVIGDALVRFEGGLPPRQGKLALKDRVESFERQLVGELLKKHGGAVAPAAREAGISRQAFYQRARKLGLLKGKPRPV